MQSKEVIRILRANGELAVAYCCSTEECGFEFIGDVDAGETLSCPKCGASALLTAVEDLPSYEEQVGILVTHKLPYTTQFYRRAKRPDQKEWVMRVGAKQVAEGDDILVLLKEGIRIVERMREEAEGS